MPENLEVDEKVTTFAHVNETSRDGAEVARWAHNPKVIRSSRISATIVGVAALFLPSMWRMGIKGEYGKMADVVYAPD